MEAQRPSSRREFLRAGAAAAVFPFLPARPGESIRTRAIPRSGERLPVVGLGTWRVFDVDPSSAARGRIAEVVERFRKRGGRLVDTSPMYGRAEEVLGTIGGHGLFLADKVWTSGREAGIAQIAESRRRLGVPAIDLLQVHNLLDVDTQLATLRRERALGRARYLGVTHYENGAYPQVERILRRERPDFLQINYSVVEPEAETRLLPLASDLGIAVIVNRPFGGGEIFGRARALPLPGWAAALGAASWAELALKWVIAHPAVTCAIPATDRADHLEQNLRAGFGELPDEAVRRRIAAALRG